MRNQEMVAEFHRTFGHPTAGPVPALIPLKRIKRRWDFHTEESSELLDAAIDGDLVKVADALVDEVYFAYGTAEELSIDLDELFAVVHQSNMSKLGEDGQPITVNGKTVKGPNFFPPESKIREILIARGWVPPVDPEQAS